MKINNLSETAICIDFEGRISIEKSEQVFRLSNFLESRQLPWLIELVPAYTSLSVFVDFSFYKENESLKNYFMDLASEFLLNDEIGKTNFSEIFEIEVNYSGLDLEEVAKSCKLSIREVIKLHSAPIYTVAMIGFLPGFPYLIGLDKRLNMARKEKPLLRVPSGSVAIGGQQTGIYPFESPGGWHIIGYTDAILFNVERKSESLLKVGDKIKFVKVIS